MYLDVEIYYMRFFFMQQICRATLLIAVVLIGLNLRPALAALSPIINQIQQITGMSDSFFSLLTTLPVLIMGVTALVMRKLGPPRSLRKGCLVALYLIFLANCSRLYLGEGTVLLISAILAGIGIAVLQVLIPSIIKVYFASRIGLAMGIYTSAIMGGAALASGITPLVISEHGTSFGLACWALPALLAVIVWTYVSRAGFGSTKIKAVPSNGQPYNVIWRLCSLFGISTGAYTLALAWLPAYYQQLGLTEVASGGILSALTVAEIIAGLLVTFCLGKSLKSTNALFLAIGSLALGLVLLITNPVTYMYPCVISLGLGIGALFPLSLIVTLEHAQDAIEAASLTALVQGIGYILASAFPYFAAMFKAHFSDLSIAWWFMLVLCIPLLFLTWALRPQTRIINRSTQTSLER